MTDQTLFEESPNSLLVCDKETLCILNVNDRFCELYNCPKDEILKQEKSVVDIHLPKDRSKVRNYFKKSSKRDERRSDIWRHQLKGGIVSYVKASSKEFTFKNNPSILVSLCDVTELLHQQREIQESETLFKKLFTKAPQAMIMVDVENKVQKVNNSFEALFGYPANELLGKDLDKVIKPNEGYEKAPKMHSKVSSGGQIYSELKRNTKEGKEQDVIVGVIPLNLNGELVGAFGIYSDITTQKKIERELKQSLEEKRALMEEVHHRVKNNLAVISGLLQMQTLHVQDERLTKYIQNSQLRIRSMSIVHEMLYKSQKLSVINMSDYVNELSRIISNTLGPVDKEIETIVHSGEIILNVNQAIPCALIISELITNAYEYAFEEIKKGIIEITLSRKKKQIAVKVSDDGIGLPDNFDEMRKKSLGITLVENLCKQLETDIQIESGVWGTEFSFTFKSTNVSGSSSLNRV